MDINEIEKINERLDFIEFRQELLFDNDEVSRFIFELKMTRIQYQKIMDLMEEYRKKVCAHQDVSSKKFESDVYVILPEHKDDYHMCELLAKTFMETGRWEEVFFALYGIKPKYGYLNKRG